MTMQAFTTEVVNGKKYITTVSRGTEYTACQSDSGGWYVYTRRIALGRFNAGGVKLFDSIVSLCAGCKAFGSAENMAQLSCGGAVLA